MKEPRIKNIGVQSFEDYLIQQHAKQFVGTDDMMVDDYIDWEGGLDIEDFKNYVHDWFDEQVRNLALDIMARRNEQISSGNDMFESIYDGCRDIILQRVDSI